jgi:nephron
MTQIECQIEFHAIFYRFSFPAPPSSIEIKGYAHNSKVEVHENKELTLQCVVSNAKPAAQIIWYRGHVEYKSETREDNVIETNKRFTTTSTLRIKPSAEDDYVEYSCQAKHKALQPDMPMRASVQLSVLCKYYIYIST